VARKGQRRKGVELEHADLEHLGPCRRTGAGAQPAAVGDADHARCVGLGDVIDADQTGQLDRRADLLETLAHRRSRWILIVVDESPGQAP